MECRDARVRFPSSLCQLGGRLGGFSVQRTSQEDLRPRVRLGQHRAEPRDDGGLWDGGDGGHDDTHYEGAQGGGDDGVQMFESTRTDPGLDADGSARRAAAEDEQDRWDRLRPQLHAVMLECITRNLALVQSRKAAVRAGVEAAIRAASCQCSACGSKLRLASTGVVQVLWVGQAFTFMLDVPIRTCMACRVRFAPLPPMAGCFPSTPVRAWDLTTARDGDRPVWFDLSLLQVHSHPMLDDALAVSRLDAVHALLRATVALTLPRIDAVHALQSLGIMRSLSINHMLTLARRTLTSCSIIRRGLPWTGCAKR